MMTLLLPCISSCNNDDDVLDIFVGRNKTWKLTFISRANQNTWYDFWGSNEQARESSLKAMENDQYFILNFEGGAGGVETGGGLSGRAIKAQLNGTWNVREGRKLTITLQGSPNETDPLAKAFVNGLKGITRYEGDTDNLFLYYKEGQTDMKMAFHVE